ncbi:Hsp70 family protein [Bacteriovorax stolpii]|uniref:Hsp70 family protein n=2 Tax=Bacteriovorax stolpii TaxID=960 RepID=A0A2K9NUE1_BACTC|nr:Hsp70 family protein [Bacteriovorax stolpii]
MRYTARMSYYAVDFGTSNSLLSHVSSDGKITPIPLEQDSALVLRSLLYTPEHNKWFFGKEAIKEYINNDGEGRFFRSVKKFLPESNYSGTTVFNKTMNISEIVAVFLGEMRRRANKVCGENVERIVLGRPALYSLNPTEDQLAQDRMQRAAEIAGFKEVLFCPEPIAAGLDYSSANGDEKIILIADFGGGTSDFTLMKVHTGNYSKDDILGLSGIFKAGDALDGMMMRDFIAPHFGSRFEYKIPGGNNVLTFPRQLLTKICSPAHITHLRERDTWEFLQHIQKFALSSDGTQHMNQLFTLVECQLGFPVFDEIEKTKVKLGGQSDVLFRYTYPGIDISEKITKEGYEESISSTVENITSTMMEVFTQSGISPKDVDQVCLTGGTSQLKLIRQKLAETFGEEKLIEYNIYQSVVNGLAQYAKRQIKA